MMSKKNNFDFDILSEHEQYYRKLRKNSFIGIFITTLLSIFFSGMIFLVIEPLDGHDPPYPLLYENWNLVTMMVAISAFCLSILFTKANRKKAKSALSGNLIQLEKPRWVFGGLSSLDEVGVGHGYILTKSHPMDNNIGVHLYSEFSEDLKQNDVLFLLNAECVTIGNETKNWSMPKENFSGRSDSDGGSYSWGDSEYHGSTTYYHADLKLKSTERIFSTTEYHDWIKVGDKVNIIVKISKISEEKCKLRILKIIKD
jgi:hypothetical protein